jgi:UDP-N-acetylmuramyl pentapeptide synthase
VVAIATDLYGVDVNHDLPEFVRSALGTGNAAVLVKGSRVVGLERLIDDLIAS